MPSAKPERSIGLEIVDPEVSAPTYHVPLVDRVRAVQGNRVELGRSGVF